MATCRASTRTTPASDGARSRCMSGAAPTTCRLRGLKIGGDVKITLDLSKLVEEGKLSSVEAERLRRLAAKDTSSLAINLLVGFGVVAVSAGALALVPRPETALILGVVVFAFGLALTFPFI